MESKEYNTEVTNEEILNGVKDDYGCIYSPDGKRLLKGSNDIESYTIKKGTEAICDYAFSECESLRDIVFPESVTEIGYAAFLDCTSLQSVVIPESVTEISEEAFCNCNSLQSIVIPDSVTQIGDMAFLGCESLQSISFPESTTIIGNSVLSFCTSLKNTNIPKSLTQIGFGVFPLGIEITSNSERFIIENDFLIDTVNKSIIQCLKNKEQVDIPRSVTEIGYFAFLDCNLLQSIVIPDSVTKIRSNAFNQCTSLQSVTIPNSVNYIEDWVFILCDSLRSIIVPKGYKKYFKRILEKKHYKMVKEE